MICPTCQKTVDALRAPAAKIVGGRVITYCSPECARSGQTPAPVLLARAATPAPVTPAPGAPAARPHGLAAAPSAPAPAEAVPSSVDDGWDSQPIPALPRRQAAPPTPTAVVRDDRRDDHHAESPAAEMAHRRPKRRVVLAGIGMLVAAGIGGAIVQTVSPGRSSPAAAADALPGPAPIPEPVVPAEPAPPTKEAMLVKARGTLEGYLADASPRIRREAAMALGRTGHAGALEELIKQLDAEPSEVTRVAIAEALAKAGHARGREFLVASLTNSRRDIRMSSAIALAQLGEPKAIGPLRGWLALTTHRLSAAGSLALLGDPEGLKMLKEALNARDPEPRMRAAAALGRAGDDSGKALLLEMIVDPRYDQLAATALARLGDASAVPVLTKVLVLSSLSVEAALGLRRMGVDVDLAPLAAVLEHGDEVARIEAAEATLILCDPNPPAELR